MDRRIAGQAAYRRLRWKARPGPYNVARAGMTEQVDVGDLKSPARKGVRVRVPVPAPASAGGSMASMLRAPEVILGIIVVVYILNDVFQSVVVPRPTPARYRLTRWIVRPGWRAWRTIGLRARSTADPHRGMGGFGPLVGGGLLVLWLVRLGLGFRLVFDRERV